jgi:hypothetical protein
MTTFNNTSPTTARLKNLTLVMVQLVLMLKVKVFNK